MSLTLERGVYHYAFSAGIDVSVAADVDFVNIDPGPISITRVGCYITTDVSGTTRYNLDHLKHAATSLSPGGGAVVTSFTVPEEAASLGKSYYQDVNNSIVGGPWVWYPGELVRWDRNSGGTGVVVFWLQYTRLPWQDVSMRNQRHSGNDTNTTSLTNCHEVTS